MPIYQDKDRSILPESRNRGPDRHHDPGPFRLGIPCRDRKCTSGFSPRAVRGPGSPTRPAPPVQMGAARHPGTAGTPAAPPSPATRTYAKPHFVQVCSANLFQASPTKCPVLRKCGVSPGAGISARFRSRWIVGGDTPPHHPPDLSRGAPGAPLLRSARGSAPSRLRHVPRAPQLRRSAPGAAPPCRWLRHSAALYLVRRLRP